MPNKGKHHIFSARTTEGGLRLLNGLKAKLGVGWDELIIDAISAYYSLDKGALALPKSEKPKAGRKTKAAGKPKAEKKTAKAKPTKVVKKAKEPKAKKEGEPVTA